MQRLARQRWIVRLFRLSVALILLGLFLFSPFYARSVLWFLQRFTPVEVDTVAAQSQNIMPMTHDYVVPGSPQWVAQRAYFFEVEQAVSEYNGQKFLHIERRYPLLLQQIKQQQQPLLSTLSKVHPNSSSKLIRVKPISTNVIDPNDMVAFTQRLNEYRQFLNPQAVAYTSQSNMIHAMMTERTWVHTLSNDLSPNAIVILGGGLRHDAFKRLVPNDYTVKRLEKALMVERLHELPIVLSGVEAPYMQKWLVEHGLQAQFLENNSLNTCENTRFTALLLQRKGGAPAIFLITDAYHMPRSRELFAQNGITTVPVIASLPQPLTDWQPSRQNWMHTRRANYELIAWWFNRVFGGTQCRETPS